jgi:hypothetical protein
MFFGKAKKNAQAPVSRPAGPEPRKDAGYWSLTDEERAALVETLRIAQESNAKVGEITTHEGWAIARIK